VKRLLEWLLHGAGDRSVLAGAGFRMRFSALSFPCSENQALSAKIFQDAAPERDELLRVGVVQFSADLPAGRRSGRRGGRQQFEQSQGDGIDLDEADAIISIAIDDELRRLSRC